jgi:drug/metabolite transporter (DMT)-like permease
MSSTSRPLDAFAVSVMTLLCLSWGFNQVAVKLALPEIPPLVQAAIRSAGASLIVLAWSVARGVPLVRADRTLRWGVAAGVLFGLEFILVYGGLAWTTAGRAVVFLYTAPFFVVLGSRWLLPGDRFSARQWAGLALSFGGIAVAFGVPAPAAHPRQALGDLLLLAGAAGWAATTLLIKASPLSRAPAEKTLLYQTLVSTPILAAGALLLGQHIPASVSAVALGALAYQTVWVVSLTYLAWFGLMMRYSANRLSAFTFLTPLFGVAAGWLVLGEPITLGFAVAAALVAAGLVLVNRPGPR